jgi:hypothetical protein
MAPVGSPTVSNSHEVCCDRHAGQTGPSTMTYIDAALLNLVEWFCRKVQLLTGWTNVWLAFQLTNLSVILYFVWAGLYLWTSDDRAMRIVLAVFFGLLLYVLSQTIFKVSVETQESNAYRRVAKGFRNPRRQRDVLLRVPFLTLSVVLFYPVRFVYLTLHLHIVLLGYFLVVLTTVVLYLLACDPLPPCTGKVRARFLQPLARADDLRRQEQSSHAASSHDSDRCDPAVARCLQGCR